MRICLVLHGWPPATMGGTGLYVEALARALVARGHTVACLSPQLEAGWRGAPQVQAAGGSGETGEIFRLRAGPPERWEQGWSRPDLDAAFRGFLASWGPDLVHVHHLSHGSLGWLRAVRREGRGLVLTLHDYALPCARGQLVDRSLQLCPGPSDLGCATCVAEQLALSPATAAAGRVLAAAPVLRGRLRGLLAAAGPARGAQARIAARRAAVTAALLQPHRLLSPSQDLARRFQGMGLRRPELHPLPLVRPVPPAPPPGAGPLRLLFASSMLPTKGPDRLLAAFARLPQGAATLSLAGASPPYDGQPGWAKDLRRRAEQQPGVRWWGEVPPAQVPALLADHDVLVLPSTWPENSPLIVREATAAGLRTLLPRQGGARELDPLARLVPGGDDDALLSALQDELLLGRGRHAPRAWPSAGSHAADLEREVYASLAGRLPG